MKHSYKTVAIAGTLGILVYLFVSVFDWLFFFDRSFFSVLFDISGHHLFTRLMYVILIFIFGLVASQLISNLQNMRERESYVKRVLLAIRNINRLITHEADQVRLLDETCRLLVESQGFYNAWIVLLKDGRPVEPFHHFGFGHDFAPMTRNLKKGVLAPCASRVLNEEKLQVIVDPVAECGACPNRPVYAPDRAALAVPLKHDNQMFGWLTVSCPRMFTEDPEEQRLLTEVANDIAFALRHMKSAGALKESEKRYREIFRYMSDAVAIYEAIDDGRDFVFKDINPAATETSQLRRSDIIGRPVCDIFPGFRETGMLDALQRVYRTGRSETLSARRYQDEKRLLWVESYAFKLLSGEVVAVYTDLTGRKQAEADYRRIYHMTMNLIGVTDLKTARLIKANPAFERTLGYSETELTQKPFWEFVHPDDRKRTGEILTEHARRKKDLIGFENRGVRKDGTYRNLSWNVHFIADDRLGFCVAQDITERKQAEADLERLRSAVEQSREMFLITDAGGAIQYVNPAFEFITGYSKAEVVGQNPRILKSGKQSAVFYENLWRTISGGENWRGRFVNKRKDGTLYTEDAAISPVRDAAGHITNYVAVKHDITEQLRVHDEKLQLEAQVQQAQKLESVGRLAGGVAHDLNNLLSPIIGFSEILANYIQDDTDQKDAVDAIIQAAMSARDMVDQLLAFSRKQVLNVRPIDLNQVVTSFEKLLRRTIREDVMIHTTLAPSLPLIRGDSGQLEQVIMNLMVNAQDAMPDGGQITIETTAVSLSESDVAGDIESAGPYVMLRIGDTGCGMDAGTREHLFEPFFTTKPKGQGTGLGLATAYGIIKQHGGGIRVASQPGQGTSFSVFLPVTEEDGDVRPEKIGDSDDLKGSETILLVEDDDQVRSLSRAILMRQGYNVLVAEDGDAALAALQDHDGPVHLLLTDVIMPGMSGRDLAEKIAGQQARRDATVQLKVLYMSGYTDDVVARHGVLEDGINFIQKPFSVNSLAAKVRLVLNKE